MTREIKFKSIWSRRIESLEENIEGLKLDLRNLRAELKAREALNEFYSFRKEIENKKERQKMTNEENSDNSNIVSFIN